MELEKDACTSGLTTRIVGNIIHFHDSVSSTNEIAKDLASGGGKEGIVVIARKQTDGKGRMNRSFSSPEGGIYLSVILRPGLDMEEVSSLPLVIGLSVSKAIQCTIYREAKLKWPNDVLVDGKKVAGILTTSSVRGKNLEYIIAGIGIDLNINTNDLPEDIRDTSGSLKEISGKHIDPNEFTRDLLYFLDLHYSMFIEGRSEDLLDQWSTRSSTIGSMVSARTEKGVIEGKAIGIDQTGALILKSGERMQRIHSGDCIKLE